MSKEKKTFDDYLVKKINEETDKENNTTVDLLKKAREYFRENRLESIKKLEEKE